MWNVVPIDLGNFYFSLSVVFFVVIVEFQPSDGMRKVVYGFQVTDEEVESLNKR